MSTASDATPQPVPQPQEATAPMDFDQLIACIHKFYKRFKRSEAAYRKVNGAINQTASKDSEDQKLAPMEMPTGIRDEDNELISIVFDFEAAMRHQQIMEPEERKKFLETTLGPFNNLFVHEYSQSLVQLQTYVNQAAEALKQAQGATAGG